MENKLITIINQTMSEIKKLVDVETVIGKPIAAHGTTVIPVSRVSVGIVGAETRRTSEPARPSDRPEQDKLGADGIGSGVTVNPIGFLVLESGSVSFIKTQGDSVDKWLDIVQSAVKNITKKPEN